MCQGVPRLFRVVQGLVWRKVTSLSLRLKGRVGCAANTVEWMGSACDVGLLHFLSCYSETTVLYKEIRLPCRLVSMTDVSFVISYFVLSELMSIMALSFAHIAAHVSAKSLSRGQSSDKVWSPYSHISWDRDHYRRDRVAIGMVSLFTHLLGSGSLS